MKKFNELSENISESEYRNNGRFHYSDISGYVRNGFSYLMRPEKEESESLTFGSMVDCIVTEGIDRFNERYCVARDFNLSDNQKVVISRIAADTDYDKLEDVPSDIVLESLRPFYKMPESQFAKLVKEGSDYYRFLFENKGKTPVDFMMYNDAIDVANAILNSPSVGFLFSGNEKNVDRFFQLKFNGDIDGIPVTCMTDLVYVDHEQKKIWIVDLKTTCAGYEWEFPKSFVKWRYKKLI